MTHDEIEQLDIIDEDTIAQENYIERIFSKRVPPPKKQETTFWSIVGIDASLFTISALAGAVLSSIRTGGLFYILEQELLKKYSIDGLVGGGLSTLSLVMSLLAFEGFLLAVGFTTGRRNSRVRISLLGIILTFLVVLSAGVFSGLGIVDVSEQANNWINLALAIVTAIGATFITYFGGENIGYSFAVFERRKKEIEKEFQEEYSGWIEGAIKSYQSSKYNIRSKNYIGKKLQQQEEFSDEDEEDSVEHESYHYVRDFKNAYTNDEKFEIWKQGKAWLAKKFPNQSDTQSSRWWSNLTRDLVDAGYLKIEKGTGDIVENKVVSLTEDDEDW